MSRTIFTFLVLLCGTVIGCGGGGGGSSSGLPARVDINVDPGAIDSGDRTSVWVDIFDVNEPAIAVKIRCPVELSYVRNSSYYLIDGELYDTGPDENESDDTDNYLVFYFQRSMLGRNGSAQLQFQLEGMSDIPSGRVGVDADLDNPEVSNKNEFDVAEPKFDAQDSDDVRVGPEPDPTATPST